MEQERQWKISGGFLIFSLSALLLAWSCAGLGYSPGNYASESPPEGNGITIVTGTGQGFRGPIIATVLLEGHTILGIEAVNHGDDPFIGGAAIDALVELALEGNTADLDAISGATESSMGFLAALEDALEKGRGE